MSALDEEQAHRLLEAARGHPLEAPWVVALTTGLRQGELLALHWRDVDLKARFLRVTGTLARIRRPQTAEDEPRTHLVIAEPKSARSRRRVELGTLATEALRQHRAQQREDRIRAANVWADQDLVFAGPYGGFMHVAELDRQLRALLRTAGLPRIRFHDLRHTAATLLLGRDVNPKKVSEMLGHSTVALTLDTYSHFLPTMQREAAGIMDRVLGD